MPIGIYKHKSPSLETRKKMSEAHKKRKKLLGYINSSEAREKLSKSKKGKVTWIKGKYHSIKTRIKMSNAQKGEKSHMWRKSHSLKTREKISKSRKGHIVSEETRKKISNANSVSLKGRKLSEETKRKISLINKGKVKSPLSEEHKEKLRKAHIGKTLSKETKKKLSITLRGHITSEETRKKLSKINTGKRLSEETKRKLSKINIGKSVQDKHWNWQGGKTPKNSRIRNSLDTKKWRKLIFIRDNWTCRKTCITGGKLHCHHIKNFAEFPELRFNIDNGITLSEKEHRKFHRIYGKANNTKKQLKEFLT